MSKKVNQFMFLLTVAAVIMSSAIGTTTVYADDGGPTGESSQPVASGDEVTPPDPTGGEVTPSEPTGGEVTPVDEGQPAAVVEAQPVVEETVSVAEVLDQLPAGTDLVVVNEAGEVQPLATEAAAEIIATGDPMWCPSTPAAGGCTGSYGNFKDLIAALELDAASGSPVYTGAGVIWVEKTYNGNDDFQIAFDGTKLTQLTDLTILGGWDGGLTSTTSGTSKTDVSMVFVNWLGNVTIENMDIVAADGAAATFGLGVANHGDITLNNVSVNGTIGANGAKLSNTLGSGDVLITNSEFNNNASGNGLLVESKGTITLDTVQANDNSLTGASLENCSYLGGQCQGSGLVTVTSSTTGNQFNGNQFEGLVINSGGGIVVDHVTANNNDLNGASLTSTDTAVNGNVTVTQSQFDLSKHGTGLEIVSDGNISLTDIEASGNKNMGASLDTTDGTGTITVNASVPAVPSSFTGNNGTGLHAESGSTITLTDVTASNNEANGAYLDAVSNITVTNGTFNNNVHFSSPADPGIYANSHGGNITLNNVSADNNELGAGAVLSTSGIGVVNVTGGHFNGNGTFGVQAQSQDGNINLTGITASLNVVKGAYLNSGGLGNIFVNNSTFIENGTYGIYAATNKGNITLDTVTVIGDNGVDDGAVGPDNLTDYGAVLSTGNGGKVYVTNSNFTLNTEAGLRIISSGQVNLNTVLADQNGGNGVEVYSTYTYNCHCADSKVVSIEVNVDGSTFTNNGDYGLMVKPGPTGTLVFGTASTFGGNGLGDYLLDSSGPAECTTCGCDVPPTPVKDPNVVDVPFTGGKPVKQDYENFSSTILRLPNGNTAQINSPFQGSSTLEGLLEKDLPGKLGAGTKFVDGMNISLIDENGKPTTDENGTIVLKFKVPEDAHGKFSVLFWDPTLNDGAGGWIQMPIYEAGTSFPLNPDDPEDGRTIISGVKQEGDIVTLTVNFPGIFILTSR
jgi:hypothetical protein